MKLHLENKTFLITGSSRGIGKAIAKAFLEEGANVILLARDQVQLDITYHELLNFSDANKLFRYAADCTVESEMNGLKEQLSAQFKQIDGLILNVGNGSSTQEPISDNTQWEKIWSLNFNSAIIPTRIFLEELTRSKGSILFISSIAGIESIGAPTDYSTAKTAILSLSKNLSKKVAPHVRVNTLCPGNIYFEGGTWDKKLKNNSEGIMNSIKENVPMQRFGTPEEIADAALFLSSARASFITGSVLIVDGGQTKSLF